MDGEECLQCGEGIYVEGNAPRLSIFSSGEPIEPKPIANSLSKGLDKKHGTSYSGIGGLVLKWMRDYTEYIRPIHRSSAYERYLHQLLLIARAAAQGREVAMSVRAGSSAFWAWPENTGPPPPLASSSPQDLQDDEDLDDPLEKHLWQNWQAEDRDAVVKCLDYIPAGLNFSDFESAGGIKKYNEKAAKRFAVRSANPVSDPATSQTAGTLQRRSVVIWKPHDRKKAEDLSSFMKQYRVGVVTEALAAERSVFRLHCFATVKLPWRGVFDSLNAK